MVELNGKKGSIKVTGEIGEIIAEWGAFTHTFLDQVCDSLGEEVVSELASEMSSLFAASLVRVEKEHKIKINLIDPEKLAKKMAKKLAKFLAEEDDE